MAICENCEQEHDGTYGAGRFCSGKCARGFSTKSKRAEINEKVSKKLTGVSTHHNGGKVGYKHSDDAKKRIAEAQHKKRNRKVLEGTAGKVSLKIYLIETRGEQCEECKITEWNGKPITLQLHHKDGNNKNNAISNVELLCPNCHTQTDTWGQKNRN